jgi:hypothetical protein
VWMIVFYYMGVSVLIWLIVVLMVQVGAALS